MRPVLTCSVAVMVFAVMVSGCAAYRVPVISAPGGMFSKLAAPMNLRFRGTELGPKRGEAHSVSVLGIISFGDASIAAAAREGGIKTIHHADTKMLSVFGPVYWQHTTVVCGSE